MINAIKPLRHRLRRLGAAWAYGSALRSAPILLANGFPKSGTHLLTQVLRGFPRIGQAVDSGLPALAMYEGATGAPRREADILHQLNRLRPGDVVYGHLHATKAITSFFSRQGRAPFFIYRDPRDVVVSHVHYVTGIETGHVHHAAYQALPDFSARLETSILGLPELENPFPDIGRRFAPYKDWLSHPQACALKFEELVGDRLPALDRILKFAVERGFVLNVPKKDALRLLEAQIDPANSPTFRKGAAGGWKAHFSGDLKRLFKKVAGDLLIELGYEHDHDW